jgi:hypothetical protein
MIIDPDRLYLSRMTGMSQGFTVMCSTIYRDTPVLYEGTYLRSNINNHLYPYVKTFKYPRA